MCTSKCTLIFVTSAIFAPEVKNVNPASMQGRIQWFSICWSHRTVKERIFCLPQYNDIAMLISVTGISYSFCYQKTPPKTLYQDKYQWLLQEQRSVLYRLFLQLLCLGQKGTKLRKRQKEKQAVLESNLAGAEQLPVSFAFALPDEVCTHNFSTPSSIIRAFKEQHVGKQINVSMWSVLGLGSAFAV